MHLSAGQKNPLSKCTTLDELQVKFQIVFENILITRVEDKIAQKKNVHQTATQTDQLVCSIRVAKFAKKVRTFVFSSGTGLRTLVVSGTCAHDLCRIVNGCKWTCNFENWNTGSDSSQSSQQNINPNLSSLASSDNESGEDDDEDGELGSENEFVSCLHQGKIYKDGESFTANVSGLPINMVDQCMQCKCDVNLQIPFHIILYIWQNPMEIFQACVCNLIFDRKEWLCVRWSHVQQSNAMQTASYYNRHWFLQPWTFHRVQIHVAKSAQVRGTFVNTNTMKYYEQIMRFDELLDSVCHVTCYFVNSKDSSHELRSMETKFMRYG